MGEAGLPVLPPPDAMTITVVLVDETNPAALWEHRDGEDGPLPCFVQLDLSRRVLSAGVDLYAGGPVSPDVRSGVWVRWSMPVLTAQGANDLLQTVRPLAVDVLAGSQVYHDDWAGSVHGTVFGQGARDAATQIRLLAADETAELPRVEERDPRPAIEAWGAAFLGIAATTSDAALRTIAERVRAGITPTVEGNHVVLWPSAMPVLRELRDQRAGGGRAPVTQPWRDRKRPLRGTEVYQVLVARAHIPLSTHAVADLCCAAHRDAAVTGPAVASLLAELDATGAVTRWHGTADQARLTELGVEKPHRDWGYWAPRGA